MESGYWQYIYDTQVIEGKRSVYEWRQIMTQLHKGTLVFIIQQSALLYFQSFISLVAWYRLVTGVVALRSLRLVPVPEQKERSHRDRARGEETNTEQSWRDCHGDGSMEIQGRGHWTMTGQSRWLSHTEINRQTLNLTIVLSSNFFSSIWNSCNTQSSSSLKSDKIYTDNMPVLGSKNVPVDKVSRSFSLPLSPSI